MAEQDDEVQAICSACMNPFPLDQTHVIPHFNDYLNMYVTTYRCESCWLPTLEATRKRLSECTDKPEILTMIEFFERYKIFIKEYKQRKPMPVVKELLIKLLDRLKTGETKLEITGPAIPIKLPNR